MTDGDAHAEPAKTRAIRQKVFNFFSVQTLFEYPQTLLGGFASPRASL